MKIPRPGKKTLLIAAGLLILPAAGGYALVHFNLVPGFMRPALSLVGLKGAGSTLDAEQAALDLQKQADAADKAADEADPALAEGSELIPLVRTMQISLEEMGQGDRGASMRLKQAMASINRLLLRAQDHTWSGAEQDAMITYLLSGGSPESTEKALASSKLSLRRKALLSAALAFVHGDEKATQAKLGALDAAAFPVPIQTRLLMIKAQVQAELPYEQRRDMLVKAADLAVGTLVEEAATRRLVGFSAANAQAQDFTYWSQRYARRFAQSLYFGDFVADFVKAVIKFESGKISLPQPGLDNVVESLPAQLRLPVIDTLQLASLRAGYKDLCHHMSELALRDSDVPAESKQKTALYELACSAGEGKAPPEELAKINVEILSPEDKALFAALKSLSEGIVAPPAGPAGPSFGPDRPSAQLNAIRALGASVAQQLDATNKVLGGVVQ